MSEESKPEKLYEIEPAHLRHQRVAANARQAKIMPEDYAQAFGVVGERVETLITYLPHMQNLNEWLMRIEKKLDRVLAMQNERRQSDE